MESEEKSKKEFYIRADSTERVIYEAGDDRESKKDTPQVIEGINEYFRKSHYWDMGVSTVEGMAGNSE